MVLDTRGNQMVALPQYAEERHVVALRAARGKDHLRRAAAQQPGDLLARAIHCCPRTLAGTRRQTPPSRKDASPAAPLEAAGWWHSRPCKYGAYPKFTPCQMLSTPPARETLLRRRRRLGLRLQHKSEREPRSWSWSIRLRCWKPRHSDVAGQRNVQRGVKPLSSAAHRGWSRCHLLLALARRRVDEVLRERQLLIGVRLEADVAWQVDGDPRLKMCVRAHRDVALEYALIDQRADSRIPVRCPA